MYRTSPLHGNGQNTLKTDQAQTVTTKVQLELIFLLLLLKPSIKLKNNDSTMENEIPRLSPVWEHSLTTLLGHDPSTEPGIALRHWEHFKGVYNL